MNPLRVFVPNKNFYVHPFAALCCAGLLALFFCYKPEKHEADDGKPVNSMQKEWTHVPLIKASDLPDGEYNILGVEEWTDNSSEGLIAVHAYHLEYEVGISNFPVQRLRVMTAADMHPASDSDVGGQLSVTGRKITLIPPGNGDRKK